MVPSSVDISCMPVIATIAMPNTDADSGCEEADAARSGDPDEPPTADMACQPTERRRQTWLPLAAQVIGRITRYACATTQLPTTSSVCVPGGADDERLAQRGHQTLEGQPLRDLRRIDDPHVGHSG
jgi:hypothetical protein